MFDERPLERVQGADRPQPFDCLDRTPLKLHCKGEAGQDTLAVDQNRARPACPLIAPLLRAVEVQVLA
jgi:hypothetical protein